MCAVASWHSAGRKSNRRTHGNDKLLQPRKRLVHPETEALSAFGFASCMRKIASAKHAYTSYLLA
eukprot:6184414-Pleurochrysis_carterae.AAC.4